MKRWYEVMWSDMKTWYKTELCWLNQAIGWFIHFFDKCGNNKNINKWFLSLLLNQFNGLHSWNYGIYQVRIMLLINGRIFSFTLYECNYQIDRKLGNFKNYYWIVCVICNSKNFVRHCDWMFPMFLINELYSVKLMSTYKYVMLCLLPIGDKTSKDCKGWKLM